MSAYKINSQLSETLTNGLIRIYCPETDGGGSWMKYAMTDIIKKYGQKKIYNHCHEWCAGSADMAFHLMDQGIAKNVSGNDIYKPGIQNMIDTGIKNNIEHLVEAYVSDTIQGIPKMRPWDLVVSNPPHAWNVIFPGGETDQNTIRILSDVDQRAHREMFKNIRYRLSEDAEFFLIEHDANCVEPFTQLSRESGLDVIDVYEFNSQDCKRIAGDDWITSNTSPEIDSYTWKVMHIIKGK